MSGDCSRESRQTFKCRQCRQSANHRCRTHGSTADTPRNDVSERRVATIAVLDGADLFVRAHGSERASQKEELHRAFSRIEVALGVGIMAVPTEGDGEVPPRFREAVLSAANFLGTKRSRIWASSPSISVWRIVCRSESDLGVKGVQTYSLNWDRGVTAAFPADGHRGLKRIRWVFPRARFHTLAPAVVRRRTADAGHLRRPELESRLNGRLGRGFIPTTFQRIRN